MTVLRNLKRLHITMKTAQQHRALFDWTHNGERFRVVFITDDPDIPSRMVLLFTHNSGRPSFEKPIEILSGGAYVITDNFFGSVEDRAVWEALRALFYRDGTSGNALTPSMLFAEFDRATPTSLPLVRRPEPHEVPPRRDVEEADKIYFCGWRGYEASGRRPTAANLAKSLDRCGEVAYGRAVKSHLSSCWSDQPERAVPYYDPQ